MNTGTTIVAKPSFDAGFGVGFEAGYEAGYQACLKMFRGFLPPASPVVEKSRPAPKPRLDGAAFASVMYQATTVTDAQREEAAALAEIRAARRRASRGYIDPKARAQIERLKAAGYVTDPECPGGIPNPMPIQCPETPEKTPPLAPPLTKGGEQDIPIPSPSPLSGEGKQKHVSRKAFNHEKNAAGGVSKAFDPDGKGKILIIPAGDPACFEAVQTQRFKEVETQDLQARTQATIDEKNEELRQMYERRKAERRQQKQEKVAQ